MVWANQYAAKLLHTGQDTGSATAAYILKLFSEPRKGANEPFAHMHLAASLQSIQ